MKITWLGNPLSYDPKRVGGKAANLSRLAACHPVPPGFCLIAEPSVGDVPCCVDSKHISRAYLALGKRCGCFPPAVAVRSSAVDEDGRQASFAGQYESYLNICGLESLLAAIQRCHDSAHAQRALHYRQCKGLASDVRLAVLVQQFVRADVSAVVFSKDPVHGADDRVLINALWGLGESLVGGNVTPDLYTISKSDGATLTCQIADKASMVVPSLDGTRMVAVPRPMRRQPVLREDQVAALVRLACRLETQMGWPVDVECSFVGETLYLLQCRPVTT